jgi:hypothetical protein
MKKLCLLVLTVLTATGLAGCISTQSVAVQNAGHERITEFSLKTTSEGFNFRYGTLVPNAYSSIPVATYSGSMRIKPDDVCQVTWLDSSGQKHEAKIDLSKQSKLGIRSDLLFTLNQDGTITVTKLKK